MPPQPSLLAEWWHAKALGLYKATWFHDVDRLDTGACFQAFCLLLAGRCGGSDGEVFGTGRERRSRCVDDKDRRTSEAAKVPISAPLCKLVSGSKALMAKEANTH
jgi:hypothetical protein